MLYCVAIVLHEHGGLRLQFRDQGVIGSCPAKRGFERLSRQSGRGHELRVEFTSMGRGTGLSRPAGGSRWGADTAGHEIDPNALSIAFIPSFEKADAETDRDGEDLGRGHQERAMPCREARWLERIEL